MHAASLYCGNNVLAPLKSVNRKALNILYRYVCIWARVIPYRVLSRFCQIFCDRFGHASFKSPLEIIISGRFQGPFAVLSGGFIFKLCHQTIELQPHFRIFSINIYSEANIKCEFNSENRPFLGFVILFEVCRIVKQCFKS